MMQSTSRSRYGLVLFLLGLTISMIQAQVDACVEIVREALTVVQEACDSVARNEVCYGNRSLEVLLQDTDTSFFSSPGDTVALDTLQAIYSRPFNEETEEWGIALIKAQANLPDTAPGQNVTFLVMGDISVETGNANSAPMQTFFFKTGIGNPDCENAPDSIVVQNPARTTINITVNGVEVELGSTAVFQFSSDQAMEILLVNGQAEVTSNGATVTLESGFQTSIQSGTDEDNAIPTPPVAYDPVQIQHIPFNLLPEHIEIPAVMPWVDTGIELQVGEQFSISVSGLANSCNNPDCPEGFNFWTSPVGRTDFLCTAPDCQLIGAPDMGAIARIGGGDPFYVGAGGTFTAEQSGNLELTANDGTNAHGDNVGSFYALIHVFSD